MPNLAVFSTSVEVFLKGFELSRESVGLLHVRGGVSDWNTDEALGLESSPRPWRCFFMALRPQSIMVSLLHVRGGVSKCKQGKKKGRQSSPRPWRCFPNVLLRIPS